MLPLSTPILSFCRKYFSENRKKFSFQWQINPCLIPYRPFGVNPSSSWPWPYWSTWHCPWNHERNGGNHKGDLWEWVEDFLWPNSNRSSIGWRWEQRNRREWAEEHQSHSRIPELSEYSHIRNRKPRIRGCGSERWNGSLGIPPSLHGNWDSTHFFVKYAYT